MITRPSSQKKSMIGMPPLQLPQINNNGTAKSELVDQQLAVLGALRNLQAMMAQATPNGRDYQLRPKEYETARIAWIERRSWLVQLQREIEQHAEAIDTLEGR